MIVTACNAIIQRDGAFLFIQEYKPAAAGKWGLPGGKLELGESLVDCVRREVLEETGYPVTAERLLCVVNKPKTHEGNTLVKFVFVCEIADHPTAAAEHECAFLTLTEVSDLAAKDLVRGDEIPALLQSVISSQVPAEPILKIFN